VGVDARTDAGPAALRAVHAGDGVGVLGACHGDGFSGVFGDSATGPGVSGHSNTSVGVDARTDAGPAALRAVHGADGLAGLFGGEVQVTRNLRVDGDVQVGGNLGAKGDIVLENADCAEDFDVDGEAGIEPGTVMVLASDGRVRASGSAYDRRVAGVVSGAGKYKPALVLDRHGEGTARLPIALLGKVYCKVDASDGAVEVGDMLTTSSLHGHAMKATNPARAFGAVIGKALAPLSAGHGLIPVLVALQ
jgi:hypothetical protein